jgi:hypothetical protein
VKEAARMAGVPRKTLEGWRDGRGISAEVLSKMEEAKKRLRDKFAREADGALDAAAEKRDGASYRDLMIGAGMAVDKMQLLDGEPTAITAEAAVRNAVTVLVVKFSRDREDAINIVADRLDVPPAEVRQIVAGAPPV